MILHRNMVAALAGATKNAPIYPTDVHLSYLPLAHIFERIVVVAGLAAGGSLGFYQGVRTHPPLLCHAATLTEAHCHLTGR